MFGGHAGIYWFEKNDLMIFLIDFRLRRKNVYEKVPAMYEKTYEHVFISIYLKKLQTVISKLKKSCESIQLGAVEKKQRVTFFFL